jgi:hypothetical protein
MPAVPLKSEYRPTLAQMLAPSWHKASRAVRLLVMAAAAALVVGVVALTLTLLPAHISYGGPVPFSFSYRGLHRVAPAAGAGVQVERRSASTGRLLDSFAVAPLKLPPYAGGLSGELPLYAVGYIHALRGKYAGFQLQGEGKTRVNTAPAYNIYYSVRLAGQRLYGRDVLLVPERPGAREGVSIRMLTSPLSNRQVTSPLLVATAGLLYKPLRTFSFS